MGHPFSLDASEIRELYEDQIHHQTDGKQTADQRRA
jgi:hypothetical protein